jgi:hypothetical protein
MNDPWARPGLIDLAKLSLSTFRADVNWYIESVLAFVICVVLWAVIYAVYLASGIKIMVEPNSQMTWEEQMRWE